MFKGGLQWISSHVSFLNTLLQEILCYKQSNISVGNFNDTSDVQIREGAGLLRRFKKKSGPSASVCTKNKRGGGGGGKRAPLDPPLDTVSEYPLYLSLLLFF